MSTDIANIEQGWSLVPLKTICDIKNGKSDTKNATSDGLFAFFDRSKSIKRSSRYLFDCEALIIPGEGTEFLPRHFIGKFDLHQRAYALHNFSSSLNPRFLFYFLLYKKDYFPRVSVGATVKSLRMRHFEELPVTMTGRREQERIVAILDQVFAGIAAARANAEKNQQLSLAVISLCITGRFQRIREFAPLIPLRQITDFLGGSQPPKSQFRAEVADGYVRFLQIRDFKSDRHITFIPDSKKNRECIESDVMLARYGASVGQILTGKAGAYNVALMKTVPKTALVNPEYLKAYLESDLFQNRLRAVAARSAQAGFSKDDIADFPVPLPSLSEQSQTINTLTSISEETKRLYDIHQQKLASLEALKQSLLHQAFSGNL